MKSRGAIPFPILAFPSLHTNWLCKCVGASCTVSDPCLLCSVIVTFNLSPFSYKCQ